MISKEELLKRKRERTTTRVIGFCLIPIGYGIMIACMASGSPLTILGMLAAFAGIILVLRSFIHFKYKGLNKLLAECDRQP